MSIDLVPLCRFTGRIGPPFDLGTGPAGRRMVFEVLEGTADGPRLSGTLVGGTNGDWLTLGPDGTGTIDVRLLVETGDGALVLIQYLGRFDGTSPGAAIYSSPRFETGDERYRWLNRIQAVGKGVLDGSTMTYEICEVR